MSNPSGLCQCGCGQKAPIATMTSKRSGWVAGEAVRFIPNHHSRGKLNPRYNGGKTKPKPNVANGAVRISVPGHPRADANGFVFKHILMVEAALGKPLPPKAVVHHHTPQQLVACQDQGYHMLLHKRQRALKACGNPDWYKCPFCKEYDDPKNMRADAHGYRHTHCDTEYNRLRRERRQK